HRYWVNEKAGKIFCLCRAPNAEAASQVHREAHGLVAEKIIQVEPDVAELFMGGSEVNSAGAVLLPGADADARDPGIRTILFTDIVGSTSSLASPQANRLSITTTCLAAPSNSPPGFVLMRRQNRSSCPTWSLNCVKEKRCLSRTSGKLRSKVSINLSGRTPSPGAIKRF